MSTHTPGTNAPQGPEAPPQADKSKAQAQGPAHNQGDHAKKPDMNASKDNKSGKSS